MDLQIKTQRTPNPNAWKFILSQDVKSDGKVSYTEMDQCEHVPMACSLLRLANVSQVHFFENVITVTQNGASDWPVLARSVEDVIRSGIPAHDPAFEDFQKKKKTVDPATL